MWLQTLLRLSIISWRSGLCLLFYLKLTQNNTMENAGEFRVYSNSFVINYSICNFSTINSLYEEIPWSTQRIFFKTTNLFTQYIRQLFFQILISGLNGEGATHEPSISINFLLRCYLQTSSVRDTPSQSWDRPSIFLRPL